MSAQAHSRASAAVVVSLAGGRPVGSRRDEARELCRKTVLQRSLGKLYCQNMFLQRGHWALYINTYLHVVDGPGAAVFQRPL